MVMKLLPMHTWECPRCYRVIARRDPERLPAAISAHQWRCVGYEELQRRRKVNQQIREGTYPGPGPNW